jgi:hypothetical protein
VDAVAVAVSPACEIVLNAHTSVGVNRESHREVTAFSAYIPLFRTFFYAPVPCSLTPSGLLCHRAPIIIL